MSSSRTPLPLRFLIWTHAAQGRWHGSNAYPGHDQWIEHRVETSEGERVYRVAPYVAELIHITDEKVARHTAHMQRRLRPLRSRVIRLRARMEAAATDYRVAWCRHSAFGLRGLDRPVRPWVYACVLTGIAAIEVPLNGQAFRVMFDDLESYVVGALLALALPPIAHALGIWFRQGFPGGIASRLRHLVLALSGIAALVAVFVAISRIRAAYTAATAATRLTGLGADEIALAMLPLNLILLAGAVFAASLSHDPDRELERTVGDRGRARRELRRAFRSWSKVASLHDALVAVHKKECDVIEAHALAGIKEYVDHNLQSRDRQDWPHFFRDNPIDRDVFQPIEHEPLADDGPTSLDALVSRIEAGQVDASGRWTGAGPLPEAGPGMPATVGQPAAPAPVTALAASPPPAERAGDPAPGLAAVPLGKESPSSVPASHSLNGRSHA